MIFCLIQNGGKMKNIILIFLVFMMVTISSAQEYDTDEAVIRKVADYIIEHAEFTFEGVKDGKTYKTTDEIPDDVEATFKSRFGEWHYTMGVLNMAMVNLSSFLNEDKYFDFAAKHIAFGFDNYKFFQNRFKHDRLHHRYPFGQLWTMKELDDFGAMGASIIDVYKKIKRPDYKEYIENGAKRITKGQERLEDGTLVRTFPHEMTVWADDLYMSVPFLVRLGRFTGDNKYYDDAIHQVLKFSDYLWDENREIYWHCYYSDLKRNGVAHWGRCNGWVMLAQVHLLNIIPKDYPKRDLIIKNLERQIIGIAKYQGPDGLWHQILDRTDSYTESSCSAMFVYGIARAVNEGWIDKRYSSIAVNGWSGLIKEKILPDGQVKDICVGTGIEDDMVFYYHRPARTNEKHGLGAVIDAGIEIIRLKNTNSKINNNL
jgi:unsaturated rhamnogalacturonyl hydrolase